MGICFCENRQCHQIFNASVGLKKIRLTGLCFRAGTDLHR